MPRSQDIFRANPPLTLTRRRSLQILMAGGLTALLPSELWLTGCGGVSSLLTGHLVNLTPTRIAIPVGGYGFIRASADGSVTSENLFRLGITLPPSVEEVNPSVPVTLHVNVLHAMAAATPGRYLCGLRVKPRSDVDGTAQDEPFEIIVIPANQSIGLTIGPYGTFAGPASPGGGSQFAVTATATQRVLPSEWPGAQAQAGFTGEVRFRLEGLPTGISGGFSRPSVTLGEGSNGDRGVEEATILTISVGSAVAVGTYPFTVLADHDTPTKTARIQGNLVVVTAGTATPTPVPTPRPTPSPTPAPSPTPGPTGRNPQGRT